MNFINMQNYFKCNGHEKYWHKYICTHIQTYLHTFFCAHVCVRELILLKFIMWCRFILLLGFFSHKFYNRGLYNNILKSFGPFWFRICHTFFFPLLVSKSSPPQNWGTLVNLLFYNEHRVILCLWINSSIEWGSPDFDFRKLCLLMFTSIGNYKTVRL